MSRTSCHSLAWQYARGEQLGAAGRVAPNKDCQSPDTRAPDSELAVVAPRCSDAAGLAKSAEGSLMGRLAVACCLRQTLRRDVSAKHVSQNIRSSWVLTSVVADDVPAWASNEALTVARFSTGDGGKAQAGADAAKGKVGCCLLLPKSRRDVSGMSMAVTPAAVTAAGPSVEEHVVAGVLAGLFEEQGGVAGVDGPDAAAESPAACTRAPACDEEVARPVNSVSGKSEVIVHALPSLEVDVSLVECAVKCIAGRSAEVFMMSSCLRPSIETIACPLVTSQQAHVGREMPHV